jgi:two-component system, NtrC family, response regulator AtoC
VNTNPLTAIHDLPPMEVIFGSSPQMRLVRATVERVTDSDLPVLIQGESGTGKEIIAKLLHYRSDRAAVPWVKVICPAIPAALIESELFGYEKGAFTGANTTRRGRVELAHGGTLFLDEIGSLDTAAQAKLLQLLQDGSFTRVGGYDVKRIDARIVSAANGDLQRQLREGSLRLDFLVRINAITIDLPPLRSRIADLPSLVNYFIERYSIEFRARPKPLSGYVHKMMQRFDWPGNIRQLENMIRSYVLIGNEEALANEFLRTAGDERELDIDLSKPLSLKELTKAATTDLERRVILQVLQANEWNRQKTARWLKMSYRSLLYKLEGSPIVRRPRATRRARPPNQPDAQM